MMYFQIEVNINLLVAFYSAYNIISFILIHISYHPKIRNLTKTRRIMFCLSYHFFNWSQKSQLYCYSINCITISFNMAFFFFLLLLLHIDYEHIKKILLVLVFNFVLKCIQFRNRFYDIN